MDSVAVVLALALAAPAAPLASLRPATNEVEQLYIAGQKEYEARDYANAARTWTRLLDVLPESTDNRAIRESVIINILEAHVHAYELLVDAPKDIEHLRTGRATLRSYYAAFAHAYGERVAVSQSVREIADELEAALREAEEDRPRPPPPPDVLPPDLPPPPPPAETLKPVREGNGLIIGGAVAMAAGLGAVVMIPIGSVRGERADAAYDDAARRLTASSTDMEAERDLAEADLAGQKANAMLIAGAVIAPLLVAAGATMIGLGVRSKQRAQRRDRSPAERHALAPMFAPGFAGVSLRGRF